MEWFESGLLIIGSFIVLVALSIPVAFAFFIVSGVAMFLLVGTGGVGHLTVNMMASVTRFTFIPIPLFVLMGSLFYHTGLALRVFDAFDALFGRIHGRLSYLTIAIGTTFASLSGTTMGSTAMLGSLMVPEMTKRGYKKHLSMGPIMGVGGLAMLIPPSGLAVLLGSIARVDIGNLLVAGILPGLTLALLYAICIFVQIKIDPEAAPHYDVEPVPWGRRITLVVTHLLPMGLIIFMVIGLIILGLATPTESAAFGVLSVLILASIFRVLSWGAIRKALTETLYVTVMVLLIVMGSSIFAQVLALSGATGGLVDWVSGAEFQPTSLLITIFTILLLMGTIMEPMSIMLITVPIFYPLAITLGFDPIWFSVIVLLAIEISLVTPPVGVGLFVMLGVAPKGTTLLEVSRAVAPFIICDLILFTLLLIMPSLALFLPKLIE